MSDTKVSFGEYLGALLKEKNVSINELAHRMHGDSGHISRVIRGERKTPKPDMIKAIANSLGVPYEEMLEHTEYIDEKSKEMQRKSERIAAAVADPDSEEAMQLFATMKNAGLNKEQRQYVVNFAAEMAKKSRQ